MTRRNLSAPLFLLVSAWAAASVDIPKDLLKQRDPFKMPAISRAEGPKSELELYPLEQFRLVGVLAGAKRIRAMVAAPNGKTYFVKEHMILGQRKGMISKITDTEVHVREKTINVLGEAEFVDSVLKLPNDSKQDVKTITSGQGW